MKVKVNAMKLIQKLAKEREEDFLEAFAGNLHSCLPVNIIRGTYLLLIFVL